MHNKQASFVYVCIESIYTLHRSHFEIYLPKQSQKTRRSILCSQSLSFAPEIKHAPLDFMYYLSAIHGVDPLVYPIHFRHELPVELAIGPLFRVFR